MVFDVFCYGCDQLLYGLEYAAWKLLCVSFVLYLHQGIAVRRNRQVCAGTRRAGRIGERDAAGYFQPSGLNVSKNGAVIHEDRMLGEQK